MDHSEAVRIQAAEKYVLGELAPELREQYEEHYFDCPECTKDLKALAMITTAGRMVFEEERISPQIPLREKRAEGTGWFGWLRPVIAVPAMATLAAIIVFQNVVTIPSARQGQAFQGAVQVYASSYHLQGSTRGLDVTKVTVRPNENFALDFDFTPAQVFPNYQGILVDRAGRAVFTFRLTGEQSNREVHLVIPGAKVQPGNYELVFSGDNGTLDANPKSREVLRIPFELALEP